MGYLTCPTKNLRRTFVATLFLTTRAYGAIAPEPLGCASHSCLLTEESVTDKQTNERTHIVNY